MLEYVDHLDFGVIIGSRARCRTASADGLAAVAPLGRAAQHVVAAS